MCGFFFLSSFNWITEKLYGALYGYWLVKLHSCWSDYSTSLLTLGEYVVIYISMPDFTITPKVMNRSHSKFLSVSSSDFFVLFCFFCVLFCLGFFLSPDFHELLPVFYRS